MVAPDRRYYFKNTLYDYNLFIYRLNDKLDLRKPFLER